MFKNRVEAGVLLAKKLQQYEGDKDSIIVALPRGGVVVGFAISEILNLPLTALIVKKITTSTYSEFAIGALAQTGDIFWDRQTLNNLKLTKGEQEKARKTKEIEIKNQTKSLQIPKKDLKNKKIILVDDGAATGATAIAAAISVQNQNPKSLILAIPVIASDTKEKLKKYFDEIIALETPNTLNAVGEFYSEFDQVSDEKVKMLLKI